MGQRPRTVMLALCLALPLAACGGGGQSPTDLPPGPAGSAPSASPSTEAMSGQDPVASYLRFWDVVVAANRAADPGLAALRTVAAGAELSRVQATVSRNKVQKLSLRGEVGHSPGPARMAGTTATIEDCYDISRWNPVRLDTGKPVEVTDESGTGRYRARYTLRRSVSGWLVVNHTALGSC